MESVLIGGFSRPMMESVLIGGLVVAVNPLRVDDVDAFQVQHESLRVHCMDKTNELVYNSPLSKNPERMALAVVLGVQWQAICSRH